MRKIPPLKSLQAFEATARHLSFSKASEELFVTPAAVSQQVRQLEDWLQVQLFRRLTREIRWTDAGQKALPLITEGFDRLAEGVQRLTEDDETGILTVTTAPTFAAKWLVPRLAHFNELYPDLNVRIDASLGLVDFEREGVHIGIRLGGGEYPRMRSDWFMDEDVILAFSPLLMEGPHPLVMPNDLKHHRLLHVDWGGIRNPPSFEQWLKLAGVEGVDVRRGDSFTVENLAIQVAISGGGVVLVSKHSVEEDLEAGRLIAPFDISLATEAYWIVSPERLAERPKIVAFRNWLFEEAGQKSSAAALSSNATDAKNARALSPKDGLR